MDIQTPPFLELHNAVVQRAGAPILTVDSFRLEEREHLALLGPNGSGKSTFVMLITREVLPCTGKCRRFGFAAASVRPLRT